ncbi:MAG: hypothetical protein IKC22_02300 [Bacilli bacterium]|nr:hypothetical protein [Bacilli bacterium]
MKRPFYTRKDLIKISLAFFYSFLLMFVGMCIETGNSFISKRNPFMEFAKLLNFKSIECGVSGYIFLLLVAIYVSLFVSLFLYEKRYAIVNNKKPFGSKMLLTYLYSFLACSILSFGLGIVIQRPLTGENIGNALLFIWQAVLLTTIVYVLLVAFIGGIIMFIINFILIDKPFKAFEDNNEIVAEIEDDPEVDVANSFDVDANMNAGLGTGGFGGIAGAAGGGEQSVVRSAEELDDREKVFPGLSTIDVDYSGYAIDRIETDSYSLEEICIKFRNYLAKEEKLYFDLDTIRYFVSAFGTTHFMILEGLSGTGKSSLPRYFAKFLNAEVLFIPVQATWRDRTNLIGFFNEFSKTYTETEFLLNLYEANYNPDKLHFYVLDEMNISRIEYYFADFLSVLEYPVEDWKLKVMQLPFNFIPPAKLNEGIIQIPENSYFVGTANKDDSTFTITDKVYDRAITIDFDNRNEPFEVNDEVSTINISASFLKQSYEEARQNSDNQLTAEDLNKFTKITDYIYDQFDITFGNRILTQIERIVPVFVQCGGKKEDALDFLLSRKVISKIEGRFEEYVKGALKELLQLLETTYGKGVFKRSEKTINGLMRRL